MKEISTLLFHKDITRRQELGDRFISGIGFEIGAGLAPSKYRNMTHVTYLDKRSQKEIEDLFKKKPPYGVITLDQALTSLPDDHETDFIVAHHVLEHAHDVIKTLIKWLKLLGKHGVFFISMPSPDNTCEKDRLTTPIDHLIDDYVFNRKETDYESKDHILSFINQWTFLSLDNFWYAKSDVKYFANASLLAVKRDDQDLHWHTFSLDVAIQVVETAFCLSKQGFRWLHKENYEGSLYLIGKKDPSIDVKIPDCIKQGKERFLKALQSL